MRQMQRFLLGENLPPKLREARFLKVLVKLSNLDQEIVQAKEKPKFVKGFGI